MKGSTRNMFTAAALALLLALFAGVAQAAPAHPWCERYGSGASDGQDGRLVASHIVRDGQGCIIGP